MSTSTSESTRLVLGVAAAAPIGIGLFGLLLGLGIPPVREWFWPTPTTNIAEAAALGDAARVRWLAVQGASLDAPLPLRDDLRASDEPPVMSPLEAAMRRGHDDVVQVLVELGARLPADAPTVGVP